MRATQQARRKQRRRSIADRLTAALAGALVVVAVVTLLPASSQQRITALGCRALTVGLTDCVARLYTPPVVDLRAVPVCEADAVLDRMVPTVERQRLRFPDGGELERWVGRDGTIRVVPRTADTDEQPPSVASRERWPQVRLLGDVALPRGGQWVFPGGVGEQQFVADLQQVYADEFQSRSAVTLFTGRPDARPESMVPGVVTAVLDAEDVETVPEPLAPAHLVPGQVTPADGQVRLLHDRGAGTTYTTLPVRGDSVDGTPVSGVLRWGRGDGGGALSEVLLTAAWRSAPDVTEVVHLHLPVGEGDEDEVQRWLTSAGGVLDLTFLADGSVPPRNEVERLLAAAATVVLEQRSRAPEELVGIVTEQFAQDRRIYGDLVEERGATAVVRPAPSGGERVPVEAAC